jgi:hypothetical protein
LNAVLLCKEAIQQFAVDWLWVSLLHVSLLVFCLALAFVSRNLSRLMALLLCLDLLGLEHRLWFGVHVQTLCFLRLLRYLWRHQSRGSFVFRIQSLLSSNCHILTLFVEILAYAFILHHLLPRRILQQLVTSLQRLDT